MFSISSSGSFKNTQAFLNKMKVGSVYQVLDKYGKEGVSALSSASPKDTSLLASSWGYVITKKRGRYTITWTNKDIENGLNIALIVQYGHGTKNGSWVEGRDFINPAIQPIFDKMIAACWEGVKNA